jgi:hypothetical protein
MNKNEFLHLSTLTHWASHYEAYCTSLAAHGCVAPPRNGMKETRISREPLKIQSSPKCKARKKF